MIGKCSWKEGICRLVINHECSVQIILHLGSSQQYRSWYVWYTAHSNSKHLKKCWREWDKKSTSGVHSALVCLTNNAIVGDIHITLVYLAHCTFLTEQCSALTPDTKGESNCSYGEPWEKLSLFLFIASLLTSSSSTQTF